MNAQVNELQVLDQNVIVAAFQKKTALNRFTSKLLTMLVQLFSI
jgi:hypothetical protein